MRNQNIHLDISRLNMMKIIGPMLLDSCLPIMIYAIVNLKIKLFPAGMPQTAGTVYT
jgi:hypothetical protein